LRQQLESETQSKRDVEDRLRVALQKSNEIANSVNQNEDKEGIASIEAQLA
jgi:hypothetical protein